MKTVLSFIDWYLPGYRAGGTLKAFANQVSHFNNDYSFKIITRDTDYMETIPYDNVNSDEWNKIGDNIEVFYLSAKNINFKFLSELISKTTFDSVYIHGIYSIWFSILPVYWSKKYKAKKIVISSHGMLGKHALSVKSNKKKAFVKIAKLIGLYKNTFFHAANKEEAADIKEAMGSKAKIIIAEEMPMNMVLDNWKSREKTTGLLKVVTVARIAPEKNILYALQCLQNCKAGKIIYDIYGPVYEHEYWESCKKIISKLPDNVTVVYKGSIEGDKVLNMLKTYHLMFLPTTGENFGHTILESFMASTPVLISSNTPWQMLEKKGVGWDFSLTDKNVFSNMLDYVVNMGQKNFDELSKNSLKYANDFLHDSTIKSQNDKLFNYEQN